MAVYNIEPTLEILSTPEQHKRHHKSEFAYKKDIL